MNFFKLCRIKLSQQVAIISKVHFFCCVFPDTEMVCRLLLVACFGGRWVANAHCTFVSDASTCATNRIM